jgi:hypothetical protein
MCWTSHNFLHLKYTSHSKIDDNRYIKKIKKKSIILNKHANILIDINHSIRLISECFTDNQIFILLKWTKVVE